jgi:hypothetical protein
LVSVLDDIATDSPQGARRVQMRIQASIELLSLYSCIDTRTNDPTIRLIYADRAPLWRRQYRIIFLDKFLSFVFLSVYVRRRPPTTTTDAVPPRASVDLPAAIGRAVSLVRKLIDYGKQLAGTVQQRAAAPGFALFARPFGTADLAAILARITSGLRRAAALEARLCQRAARGQDLTPSPIRLPIARGPRVARQVAPRDAQPEPQPATDTEDARLARLPTEEKIAAEMRRRPVGAVIADICRDLGIVPGELDRAFWDELSHAIIAYGGSLAGFLGNLNRRLSAFGSGARSDRVDPGWPAAPPRLPALATGPP